MSSRRSLKNGSRVEYSTVVNGEKRKVLGVIAYGPGLFHLKPNETDWCGVILEEPVGKNNGTVQGRQYFECQNNFGVFVRASTLRPASDNRSSRSTTPSTTPSMTPSSSIASFTGMFDSGQSSKPESTNIPTAKVSKLKPPTRIVSSSQQDVCKIPQPSEIPNIRQMVEKLETKRDEKIREDDAAQDISHNTQSESTLSSPSKTSVSSVKEANELNEKIKDLESKLNTLMVKRAEDRQKFKEFERIHVQYEQLMENKKQMAEKIAELSKQKAAAEKEARDAREEQLRQSEEMKELVDSAEMAVIEKEVAESKVEQLEVDLAQVKEQLEEATIDFELLKSEIEDKGVDGAANSFQVKQLEEQNARYREALLKLREMTVTDRGHIKKLEEELKIRSEEINQLTTLKEKNEAELEKYGEQIEVLKEQVDMALGSQEMVEKLTEKNLEMEDKIEELQQALDEEEKIKELTNMINEEKDDVIADLRDEVDKYKTNIVNLRNTHIATQEAIQDHENTIRKFREVVAMLKEENSMLRAAQKQDMNKVEQAVNVQKQLENIEFKTRLLDRKDLCRAIDMELRQLDVDQCYRHMVYLARFFPESFFSRGGDYDAISVLLFVPRMFVKCSILERQIVEKYSMLSDSECNVDSVVREVFGSSTDDGSPIHVESIDKLNQQIFTKHILYLLCSIRSLLGKYQTILSKCDCELFMKLGSLFPEISSHENSINHYVELLRQDKLDETVQFDSLEKTLAYLQSLYNIHMAPTGDENNQTTGNENHNKFLNDLLDVLRTGAEAALLDVKTVSELVTSDVSMLLSSIETSINDIDQVVRKIRRRMISAGSGSSDINPACIVRFPISVEAELLDCAHNLSNIIRCLKTIRSAVLMQSINGLVGQSIDSGDTSTGAASKRAEFTMDELEKVSKDLTGNSLKALSEMLANVMQTICKFSTILQQGDYDVSGDSSSGQESMQSVTLSMQHCNSLSSIQTLFSSSGSASNNRNCLQSMCCVPLDERAMKWRAQSNQIHEYENKILTQEADISELKRGLKVKIDEVSEMQIRRDLAEKKLSTALKETSRLQEELERLTREFKEKEAEREKTLNKYNQEINELYSDRRSMKEKLKDYSKMGGKLMSTPTSSRLNQSTNQSELSFASACSQSPISGPLSSPVQFTSATSSTLAPSTVSAKSGDVAVLQQQIFDLRTAMKRLAKRNSELRSMLSRVPTSISDPKPSGKPQWYMDSLKRINSVDRSKADRLRELRAKLMDFKYDVMRYRCSASLLPDSEKLGMKRKPGWSRCLGELIRKESQEEKMHQLELTKRFTMIRNEVEQFVKSFDEGFACDSTYASFFAPHISKTLDSDKQLFARITLPATDKTCSQSVIPVEVTLDELCRLQSTLMF